MSSAPDGPPTGTSPTAHPAANTNWWIQHSLWLLLPIVGCSCLGGAGFLYVGLRARRPSWWIPGIVYLVVGWTAFILVGESGEQSSVSDWATGVLLASWVVCIAHACVINAGWLRWRAGNVPWYPGLLAPPPTWPGGYPPAPAAPRSHPSASYPPASYPPTSAPPAVADLVPDPQTYYYGADPAAIAGPPRSPATAPPSAPPTIAAQPTAPISPAGAPGPVDVNLATAEQLAALPAFDLERARRVLAERQARGGFGSVEEFALAAGLAPHEFARIRGLLVCAPGRPAPGQPPPHGRVLDY